MKTWPIAACLLIAVSLPNANDVQASTARTPGVCGEAVLPAPVNELLRVKFAGWRPQQLSDLYADDRKLWTDSHSRECPGIAIGHFEGADSLSYAVLLLPQSAQQGGYKLLVFNRGLNADTYTWRLLQHGGGKDSFAPVIYKIPPGKYKGFDETKSIRIKLDGVGVEWIEKSAFIAYWWEGSYHKIWTSD